MCGRFVIVLSTDLVQKVFGLTEVLELPARYNVAPAQPVPVIRAAADGAPMCPSPGDGSVALVRGAGTAKSVIMLSLAVTAGENAIQRESPSLPTPGETSGTTKDSR